MIDLWCPVFKTWEAYVLELTEWAWAGGAWRRYRRCSECRDWHEEVEQEEVRHV